MAKPLVIVESPAKAKTIAGYLGSEREARPRSRHHRGSGRPKKLSSENQTSAWPFSEKRPLDLMIG